MTAPEKRDGSVPPPSGDEARSSSPGVKRTAAEITEPDHEVGKGAGSAGDNLRSDSINTDSSDTADNDNRSGNHTSSTPASMATDTTPPATRDGSKAETEGIPSIDDQVAMVNCAAAQPLKENQKGYVVSMSWLKKVYARSTSYTEKAGGSATEENIGPVDNSDIVRNIEISNSVNDEAGDAYVPLFPTARSAVDFEVVPQKGWDMIMKWYGLAHGSPVIVRYAHNINRAGDVENIQYEINPPIFTIFKLSNPAEGTTPQTLKDKSTPPPRLMATRASNFQQWLKRVKGLANVKMSTKVRLWKIQISSAQGSSAAVTPGASRSASPAPATLNIASLGNCLMMDLNTFLSLPEDQRVLLRDVTDQTANSNYNGKMTLGFAGLEENEEILVLEESLGGKGSQWVTEASQKDLARYGASTGNTSAGSAKVTPRPKSKAKDAAPSQPVPAKRAPRRTRGFGGKPLGCTGLNNVGNTCYMSAALQCMQHVEELTRYFLTQSHLDELNTSNPLGHNGEIAILYGKLINAFYQGRDRISPQALKNRIGQCVSIFRGTTQQDSQELLLFLLDGLQEDVNRIINKPYIEKPDSTDEMVDNMEELRRFAAEHWRIYKARNDSVITDLFAGMYKSTIVCPVCDKVSIVFEPFNNLSLQVPSEAIWAHKFHYFPLRGTPVVLDLEVPKRYSLQEVKSYAAGLVGSDPTKLVLAEFDRSIIREMISEAQTPGESSIKRDADLAFFEVESTPTDYDPEFPPPKKSAYSMSTAPSPYNMKPDFSSPQADRMLIQVVNRVSFRKSVHDPTVVQKLFGPPGFIVVSRDEAYDFDAISRKLLSHVANLTTRNINEGLRDEDFATDGDDADSADSKINASSVEGEDGMVNVSVRQHSAKNKDSASADILSGGPIPARFRKFFQVKIIKALQHVPLVSTSIEGQEHGLMSTRMAKKPSSGLDTPSGAPEDGANASERKTSDESDDETSADSASDSDSDMDGHPSRPPSMRSEGGEGPLVLPGEGILLDWNDEGYDELFGNRRGELDLPRGSLVWDNEELPVIVEESVKQARAVREKRRRYGVSIYECIEEFKKEEILSESNAWYCPRCKEHRLARKKFELWNTPDILVVHLKRFNSYKPTLTSFAHMHKNETLVDFPTYGLDLTDNVAAQEEGKAPIYDLFAVDEHSGGLGWGHYTAYAKNIVDKQWYQFNDSLCYGPVDPDKQKSKYAYLLFYRRRSDRPLGGKFLEKVCEESIRQMNDDGSDSDSESGNPNSGKARQLGGSSRNGSSSALIAAGAAHQADDGGAEAESDSNYYEEEYEAPFQHVNSEDEEDEGMHLDTDYGIASGTISNAFQHDTDMWSFDRASNAHLSSQMTAAPPASLSDGEYGNDNGLFDDTASDRAVDGDDNSGSASSSVPDLRLASLTDGAGDSFAPTTPMDTSMTDIPPPLDADDSEDLDVVELRVNDDDDDDEKVH